MSLLERPPFFCSWRPFLLRLGREGIQLDVGCLNACVSGDRCARASWDQVLEFMRHMADEISFNASASVRALGSLKIFFFGALTRSAAWKGAGLWPWSGAWLLDVARQALLSTASTFGISGGSESSSNGRGPGTIGRRTQRGSAVFISQQHDIRRYKLYISYIYLGT